MKQKMIKGRFHHYRLQPNGPIKDLGMVDYEYPAWQDCGDYSTDADREYELQLRNAEDADRQARELADFEELVDHACEWED